MSDPRVIVCAGVGSISRIEARLAGHWDLRSIDLSAAQADPLWFQRQIAAARCVVSDPDHDEQVRSLCADLCEVIPIGSGR